MKERGFFGIGIQHTKTAQNIGTLWRSASIMGASFIFTIGKRYKKQSSDTMKSWKHIPLFNYEDFDSFYNSMPFDCRLVGIELDEKSVPIKNFVHPERCIYLLGAEDNGLTKEAIDRCHHIIQLPGDYCMNVSVAGSIAMYDRTLKQDQ
jgi:tRNA G18 (ribose-2'-O)-methylase SpoU